MKIVFCTTVKNRTAHLAQTLPRNLADNPRSTFVVLDYGGQDPELRTLLDSLKSDRLVVYTHRTDSAFQMAHAKNMAHRLGMLEKGDVLCNLDADNYAGKGFAEYIAAQFREPETFLWAKVIPGSGLRGLSGRIVVSAHAFLNAGGYDEKYAMWGPDDKDFNIRLRRLGYVGREIDPGYLGVVNHNDRVRFKEYPQARDQGEDTFEVTHDKTVVNFGKFGCGTVYRNGDATPVVLGPLPCRIFGIGMQKTATNSLHKALRVLGYDSVHWPSGLWARDVWQEMTTTGKSLTLERHYAASDLPIPILFRELDKGYPGSKFIFTVRDEPAWLGSICRHWSYAYNPFRWQWDVYPVNNKIHNLVYGQKDFDPDVMLARYKRHNAEVREYFKDRPDDLLTMDMDHGAGWKELCGFLGKLIPTTPYPREYVTDGSSGKVNIWEGNGI